MVVADSYHTSPVHQASLVDASLHNPAVLELVQVDLSRNFIEHIVDTVVETVDYALGRPSSSSRGRSLSRHSEHAKFSAFVADVIHKAEVKVPALLVTLVYIDRAKPHLQIALEQWACERVFLGALIVANKYLNDSTLKNVHWALCTGVFGKRDIGRIEREFLDVLDFDLSVSEADLLAHHAAVMALTHGSHRVRDREHTRARAQHSRPRRQSRSPPRSRSRWSADSSEMDVDSDASSELSASPRTPGDARYLPPPAKYAHAQHIEVVPSPAPTTSSASSTSSGTAPVPQFVILPTPPQAHVATHADTVYGQREPQHRRVSSALQLLHSFPLPHFAPRPSGVARHPSSASACRPIEAQPLPGPTMAYPRQVLA